MKNISFNSDAFEWEHNNNVWFGINKIYVDMSVLTEAKNAIVTSEITGSTYIFQYDSDLSHGLLSSLIFINNDNITGKLIKLQIFYK